VRKVLNLCSFLKLSAQSYAIAAAKQLAMAVVATAIIVDPIAIAHVEAVLGAVTPNRALHEPRKGWGEGRIELPRINIRGKQANNSGASSWLIAAVAVQMVGAEAAQDAGPVQEIMDQRVDSNERRADFNPQRPSLPGAQQQLELA
jgi:hypothetical protein